MTLLAFLLSVMLTLSSCSIGGSSDSDGATGDSAGTDSGTAGGETDGTDDEDVTEPKKVIFTRGEELALVVSDGALTEDNCSYLCDELQKIRAFNETDGGAERAKHEIIFGKSDREISKKAYRLLERQERNNSSEGGYVIYSDGESVAVAYDAERYFTATSQAAAVSCFVEKYLGGVTDATLVIREGCAENVVFDTVEYQKDEDAENVSKMWEEREEVLRGLYGEEVAAKTVEAFKEMYKLFDGDFISWYADLYDPETGGFYYSNSARNNDGYLPDLESTSQILGFLDSSGIARGVEGGVNSILPEGFAEKLVSWIRGMQDPNGYFYHPQWGRTSTDSNTQGRRGRDCQWAEKVLSRFGSRPVYDTPNGVRGDSAIAVNAIVGRLGVSAEGAVRAVASSNADSKVSEHLRTEESFIQYLAGLDINGNCYGVGNTLESQAGEIVARDKTLASRGESYRLADILYEWLNEHQNTETGLWTLDGSKDDYAINGLLKIASTYNKIGKPVPNLIKGASAAIDCLSAATDPEHVCCVLNPWYALTVLYENAELYSDNEGNAGASAELGELKSFVSSNAPELISVTTAKLAKFLKLDGSFSYYQKESAYASQGMPTAVPNTDEGDVNATTICILSVAGHIFNQLGINRVPVCGEADRIIFLRTLEEQGSIVKEQKKDFREDANGSYYQRYGGECYETDSTKGLQTVLRSDYYIVNDVGFDYYDDKNTGRHKQEFINMKSDELNGSRVLEYGKSRERGYYRGLYLTQTRSVGEVFVFETDIKINTLSDAAQAALMSSKIPTVAEISLAEIVDTVAQEYNVNQTFDTIARIYLTGKEDGEYRFSFGAAVPSYAYGGEILSPEFSLGEWVTVAFEVYGNGRVKYYLNNELFCETEAVKDYDGLERADAVRLAFADNATDCAMHIDFTFVGRTGKKYSQGDNFFDAKGDVFVAGRYFDNFGGMTYDSQPTSDSPSFFRASYYGVWGETLANTNDRLTNPKYKREGIAMVNGTEPSGKSGRVFEYAKGSCADYYNGIYYGLNAEAKNGTVYVFETDFKLGTISRETLDNIGEGGCLMDITLARLVALSSGETDLNESVLTVGGIYLQKNENGKYYWQLTNRREAGEEGFGMELSPNSWYTLTLEVYSDGTVKYYVDGVAMGDRHHAISTDGLAECDVIRLALTEDVIASGVRLDNTFFGKVEKELEADADYVTLPPAPPAEPDMPDNPAEDGDTPYGDEYVIEGEWS